MFTLSRYNFSILIVPRKLKDLRADGKIDQFKLPYLREHYKWNQNDSIAKSIVRKQEREKEFLTSSRNRIEESQRTRKSDGNRFPAYSHVRPFAEDTISREFNSFDILAKAGQWYMKFLKYH